MLSSAITCLVLDRATAEARAKFSMQRLRDMVAKLQADGVPSGPGGRYEATVNDAGLAELQADPDYTKAIASGEVVVVRNSLRRKARAGAVLAIRPVD